MLTVERFLMSKEPQERVTDLIQDYSFFVWLLKSPPKDLLVVSVTIVMVSLGATGAYILGIASSFPWEIVRLFSSETATHLTGDLLFITLLGWIIFKFSQPIVIGSIAFFFFLVAKIIIGPKHDRGISSPQAQKYQSVKLRRLLKKRAFFLLFARLLFSFSFVFFAFFSFSGTGRVVSPFMWPEAFLIVLMGVGAMLSAHAARRKVSFLSELRNPVMRSQFVLLGLLFFGFLGSLRSLGMVAPSTFKFSTDLGVCELSPMFPIYGGDLYYDRKSAGYIIFGSPPFAIFLENPLEPIAPECLQKSSVRK
jgi:hypothetical protein